MKRPVAGGRLPSAGSAPEPNPAEPNPAGPAPVVEPLLLGFGLASEQGSAGFCGVYLVRTPQRRILFDCGHAGRRRALLGALAHHGLDVRDVDTLVLSHAHYDHVQNADLFPHADVLLHPAERTFPLGDPVKPPWTAAILAGLRVRGAADGLQVAPGVTVVALPGHTAGSIGLAVKTATGTAVLTGDAVPSARALRAGRPTTAAAGAETAATSIELVRRRAAVVYPGHDRPFTVEGGVPGRYLVARGELGAPAADPGTEEPT